MIQLYDTLEYHDHRTAIILMLHFTFTHLFREALEEARAHVANLINAEGEDTIIFTSCGSESDNRAIDIAIHQYNAFHSSKDSKDAYALPHVISSTIEHPAILLYLKHLADVRVAIELTLVGVDEEGVGT